MLTLAALLASILAACTSGEPDKAATEQASAPTELPGPPEDSNPAQGRVVILGLPGVDPDWVDRWRRDLPNLDALLGGQRNARIDTTVPASSAVAWTTFATGRSPGHHGVYGLITRDPKTYRPVHGVFDYEGAAFTADGSLASPPRANATRRGEPFWRPVARAGLRVKLLFVPWAWPLEEPGKVEALAGEGLPDLRLTNSTFSLFATDVTAAAETADVPGGDLVRLTGKGPYTASIRGPDSAGGGVSTLPLSLQPIGVDRVAIQAGEARVEARVGAFSDWLTLAFPLSPKVTAKARVRFFPIEVGERVRVYMTPLTVDPLDPWLPAAAPQAFGREVFTTYGDWKALGWAYDTAGLSSDLVPEAVLAAELRDLYARRARIVLGELGRRDAELFVAVLSGVDAVSHMFMRLGDPSHPAYDDEIAGAYGSLVKEMYAEMDRVVGEVRERLKSGDTLILLSEAGFQSFRREFQVNSWLVERGYLQLAPGVSRTEENAIYKDQVDWRKTSAYSVGAGLVWLNVKGREANGSVPPARARPIAQEIASRLLEARDGRDAVLSRVLLGEDLYRGEAVSGAPDLVLTFMDGYQPGRATTLGGIPLQILSDNERRWSGDHVASDPTDVQGLLATTLENPPKAPRLVDIAPTVHALLGLQPPADAEGRSWVEVRPRPAAARQGAP